MSSARKRAAIQKANNEADHLRQRLILAEHHANVMKAMAEVAVQKYDELLFAVERKFPGESRHETALRYIRAAEASAKVGAGSTAAMGSNSEVRDVSPHKGT